MYRNQKCISSFCLSCLLIFTVTPVSADEPSSPGQGASAVSEISRSLGKVTSDWTANTLFFWVDGVRNGSMDVGDKFTLHAESATPGFATYLYYDSVGNGTLMYGGAADSVENERYHYKFPPKGVLPVQKPLGRNTVVVFLSENEPDLQKLGFERGEFFKPLKNTAQQVKQMSEVLSGASTGLVAVKSARYFVSSDTADESGHGSLRAKLIWETLSQSATSAEAPSAENGVETFAMNDREALSGEAMPSEQQPDPVFAIQPETEFMADLSLDKMRVLRLEGKTVNELIYFESNSATLTVQGRLQLDDWLMAIEKWPVGKLTLIGHTDDQGEESYNLQLSKRRAESAMAYFNTQGLDPRRIRAMGFGEADPVAPNRSVDKRRLNRRVEFLMESRR